MEFQRRGTRSFASADGEFRIRRPTGLGMKRKGMNLDAAGHDYEFRQEADEIWLLEGEREVGYAKGSQDQWQVIIDSRSLAIIQPKPGVPHSFVREDSVEIGQFGGSGFPLRTFRSEGDLGMNDEQIAFLALIVLTGWRETDRGMLSAAARAGDDPLD